MLLTISVLGCSVSPGSAPLDALSGAPADAAWRRFDPVRVVAWNIETVGDPASFEYAAALDVLARLDADVVVLSEIASDADAADLASLAFDADYPELGVGDGAFGADRCAILSRRALLDLQVLDAATLSGDPAADDITRLFVRAEVETRGDPLVVLTDHWKSGSTDTDEFRRSIESNRAVQALAGIDPATTPALVLGDMNEDPADLPLNPAAFFAKPAGLPFGFFMGQDLFDQMTAVGLDNDPFLPLTVAGLSKVDAAQRDGDLATFIGSNDALDHAFATPATRIAGAEVFDDQDEALPSVLHLGTAPIAAGTLADASDHHPLVIELAIPK
ncbi:MAG: endonuclease/exonuclease/phosphatase family protein [Myxococcota bacterium]